MVGCKSSNDSIREQRLKQRKRVEIYLIITVIIVAVVRYVMRVDDGYMFGLVDGVVVGAILAFILSYHSDTKKEIENCSDGDKEVENKRKDEEWAKKSLVKKEYGFKDSLWAIGYLSKMLITTSLVVILIFAPIILWGSAKPPNSIYYSIIILVFAILGCILIIGNYVVMPIWESIENCWGQERLEMIWKENPIKQIRMYVLECKT